MPTFGADAPLSYYAISQEERESRCDIGSDDCVIDGKSFFVRGCLEIPVHGYSDPFVWGVWTSLSEASFREWVKVIAEDRRSHVGPFFGWLDAWLKPYPETMNLKTMVHLRDNGIRPYIELEPTEHPLYSALSLADSILQIWLTVTFAVIVASYLAGSCSVEALLQPFGLSSQFEKRGRVTVTPDKSTRSDQNQVVTSLAYATAAPASFGR